MIFKRLLLLSIILLLLSPMVSAEILTLDHDVYVDTSTGQYETYTGTPNKYGSPNGILFCQVEHIKGIHYLILERTGGAMNGDTDFSNEIMFSNGLRGTGYLTINHNLLGEVVYSRYLIFFDNWESVAPASGYMRADLSYISSGQSTWNTWAGDIDNIAATTLSAVNSATPSTKGRAVVYTTRAPAYPAEGLFFGNNLKARLYCYIEGHQSLEVSINPLDPYTQLYDITSSSPTENLRELYLSETTDETNPFFYAIIPTHGDRFFITHTNDPVYITSELSGNFKQWLITPTSVTIPEELTLQLQAINTPPFYVGSYINYRLDVGDDIADAIHRVEFITTAGGNIVHSSVYIRNGEIFQKNSLGEYTHDQLTHIFNPESPIDHSTSVIVYTEAGNTIYTASSTDNVGVSTQVGTLRIEAKSAYDDSYIYGANLILSYGGHEVYNHTLDLGVYQSNIPLNTLISANISVDGYYPISRTSTFSEPFNTWLFPLTPSSIAIDPSECLVELTATDGINPLPNVRILFDGNVKYTGQTGTASWITTDIGTKTYSATLTGYQGYNGVLTTVSNTTVSQTIVLSPIGGIITPTITPTPTVTPGGNITPPAIGEEGWGIIEAIRWLAGTFLGVHEESLVDAILAMCLIVTCALVIVQYTKDAGGALVGGAIGFLIALVIGWIPIWIVFVGMALGGFIAFIMLSRGG